MHYYPKIDSIFKRDMDHPKRPFIWGAYSCPEFEYLKQNDWVFTEKINGASLCLNLDGNEMSVLGHRDKSIVPPYVIEMMKSVFPYEVVDKVFPCVDDDLIGPTRSVSIFGEGYGGRIQGKKIGGQYRDDEGFILFDIRIGRWWLQRGDLEVLSEKLEIPIVPIVGVGSLNFGMDIARNGFQSRVGSGMAEGVVAKPQVDMLCRNGSRIITKIKNKDFRGENDD
jgi:hypothetical protein